ncbi:MAG: CoB--CoM heterodisulfide reductase iron-sulfur subunit A family protein [Chloroflexota bacterium]
MDYQKITLRGTISEKAKWHRRRYRSQSFTTFKVKINNIGAGIAGIQAALDIADAGYQVYLVEKEPSVGGRMAQLDKTFPTLDCSACILTPKMVDVGRHENIELLTYSEVTEIKRDQGSFLATIRKKSRYVDIDKCTGCGECATACRMAGRITSEFDAGMGKRSSIYVPFPQAVPLKYTIDPDACLFLTRGTCGKTFKCKDACPIDAIDFDMKDEVIEQRVETIIVATGFDTFDAKAKPELGYGTYPEVITGLEFERLVAASGPTLGKVKVGDSYPRDVVFIHCVGSRDRTIDHPWCSRVCCMYTAKQAHLIHEKLPDSRVTVFYMDIRAFGKGFEEFYDRVREEGAVYRRGNPAEVLRRNGRLVVRAEDTILGDFVEVEADLVVLAVGLQPRKDTVQLAEMLDLEFSPDGFFLEKHHKIGPVDTEQTNVFLAGCAQGPKDIPDTVAHAKAAASSAMIAMREMELAVKDLVQIG